MKKRIALATLSVLLLFSPAAWTRSPQTSPVLQNPDFEDGFYEWQGVGELEVPVNWEPWYIEESGIHRPEWKAEQVGVGSGRVYSGDYAAKMFTTYAKHQAGLKQCLCGFEPDGWYEFSAHVYVWSSGKDDPDVSESSGKYMVALGLNPWSDDPRTYHGRWQMQWSPGVLDVYDQWIELSYAFRAETECACLYTLGIPEWAAKHNDSYWDDLSLARVDGPAPPEPTATPGPTPTPQPTPSPCPTCAPGEGCDYEVFRGIIREELEDRPPIRWPR